MGTGCFLGSASRLLRASWLSQGPAGLHGSRKLFPISAGEAQLASLSTGCHVKSTVLLSNHPAPLPHFPERAWDRLLEWVQPQGW